MHVVGAGFRRKTLTFESAVRGRVCHIAADGVTFSSEIADL